MDQAGGGAVALSQDEQRMLDEMERNLVADDPRLAARLGSFGQARLPGHVNFRHARTVGGVLALVLIAAVTVMVFVISPFASHVRDDLTRHSPQPTAAAKPTASGTARNVKAQSSAPAKSNRPSTAVSSGKTPAARGSKASRHP
jgi:Protein of unknown function (DUF3040)